MNTGTAQKVKEHITLRPREIYTKSQGVRGGVGEGTKGEWVGLGKSVCAFYVINCCQ